MTTVLEFHQVSKQFPGPPEFNALTNINFALKPGDFAAITGPSGSGKTTFLNVASGLDHTTSGRIVIAGQEIGPMSETDLCLFRRRHIGFIFQSFNLFPTLTALENVEFTALVRGDSKKTTRERALIELERVGLKDKASNLPHQLSGGQQQRVAIARALAMQPKIVFADEPTANLDSKTARELIQLFQELNSNCGLTFLFSTHDMLIVESVKQIYRMKDGELI
ncbi:MAG: ABC transporter ATP-binding protein [Bdellovibrionales bacterium]|nr:ABC transporter ATP-binding protein [Bdellovibrionales bacterium]